MSDGMVELTDGTRRPASDVVAEGRQADRILDDPVFKDAVRRAEESIMDEWRRADELTVREAAHARLRALGDVLQALRAISADGEYTDATLQRQQ